MGKILLLHGPNLNLLGQREPEIYGSTTLDEIDAAASSQAADLGHELVSFQSNAEHELIDQIHTAMGGGFDFIIINPGALTHTSIALRDAMLSVKIPFIEVHLSNVFSREEFRRHSYLSDIAYAVISGAGALGYELALFAADQKIKQQ
ncbi:MAG: type II 3-dehydroquinate dehydratase [Gammaproteobacteria bacterium]|nr:type II 3-dehydroquinate dehydratase [Gammaproteobacteria bacterium]NIQ09149.1 type II 3-dehydroquinate dehydratase [Gammaproteobacteria bacterium]NIQ74167.1 type II 3-dehydroquinate dehydratase [Gammaproteobacteria bacterium]NIR26732.1 type II 3-dehydroquinate dehydratase [Gammaproteobacteria bacterium]NIR93503.1 type II 3-dehydroquinate dehydratase [Gammaproteobacteria bacterium]